MEFDYYAAKKEGNVFGKNVLVECGAVIGQNNVFLNNCIIRSFCVIGNDNLFSDNVVLGAIPREKFQGARKGKEIKENPKIIVGSHNLIENSVVVQSPLEGVTRIGNEVCIGAFTHIAHDVTIEDHVITASHCSIGGYSILMLHANLGMGVRIHQRTVVGNFAMIGAGGVVVKHVMPYSTVMGVPARYLHINRVGLERSGMSNNEIELIDQWLTLNEASALPNAVSDSIKTFKHALTIWHRDKGTVPDIDINHF